MYLLYFPLKSVLFPFLNRPANIVTSRLLLSILSVYTIMPRLLTPQTCSLLRLCFLSYIPFYFLRVSTCLSSPNCSVLYVPIIILWILSKELKASGNLSGSPHPPLPSRWCMLCLPARTKSCLDLPFPIILGTSCACLLGLDILVLSNVVSPSFLIHSLVWWRS